MSQSDLLGMDKRLYQGCIRYCTVRMPSSSSYLNDDAGEAGTHIIVYSSKFPGKRKRKRNEHSGQHCFTNASCCSSSKYAKVSSFAQKKKTDVQSNLPKTKQPVSRKARGWPGLDVVFSCIKYKVHTHTGFPGGTRGKEPPYQHRRDKRYGFNPWAGTIPGGGHGNPPVFLPGVSHGQRSLTGYSLWGHKELDANEVTQHAHTPHPYPACQPSAHPPPLPHHLPGTIHSSYTKSNPYPCFCSVSLPGKSPSPRCAHGNSSSHCRASTQRFSPMRPFSCCFSGELAAASSV